MSDLAPPAVGRRERGTSSQLMFLPFEVVADRFRIIRSLGRGGMGEVYEAVDLELGQHVAVKTFRADAAAGNERIRHEVTAARRVTHPNVCRIYDIVRHKRTTEAGGHEVVVVLAMELLVGETLEEHLRRTAPLAPRQALPIVRQICEGLAAVHSAGLVHRDLKPSNIVLVPEDRGVRAVITDFGTATAVTGPGVSSRVEGTPSYMAPEQVNGEPPTPASDIYSLGVLVHEMLTGHPATSAGDVGGRVASGSGDRAATGGRLQVRTIGLPPRWARAISSCLASEPEQRPRGARELLWQVEGVIAAAARACPVRARYPSASVRRAMLILLLGAGLATAVATQTIFQVIVPIWGGPSHQAPRISAAILGFRNGTGRSDLDWVESSLLELMAAELGAGGGIRMVPSSLVGRARNELSLHQGAAPSAELAGRLRQNLAADVIIDGDYHLRGGSAEELELQVDVLRLSDGERLARFKESSDTQDLRNVTAVFGRAVRSVLGGADPSAESISRARASVPSDPSAARLYAEGLAEGRSFRLTESLRLLQQAATLEPDFSLTHFRLSELLEMLGRTDAARVAAERAFAGVDRLPRQERLLIEGRYHLLHGDFDKAIERFAALWLFFPDDLEHGLRLAATQVDVGRAVQALATVAELRKLAAPQRHDPRIDLVEARAAASLSSITRQEEAARRALRIAHDRGARLLEGRARLLVAQVLAHQGRVEETAAMAAPAKAIFEAIGDRRGVADVLVEEARLEERAGSSTTAAGALAEALQIYRSIGDLGGQTRALAADIWRLGRQGRIATAQVRLDEALAMLEGLNDRRASADLRRHAGEVMWRRGDILQARRQFQRASAEYEAIGYREGIVQSDVMSGFSALRLGDVDDAVQLARRTADLEGEMDLAWATSMLRGVIELNLGDLGRAGQIFSDGGAAAEKAQRSYPAVLLQMGLGMTAYFAGDLDRAMTSFREGAEIAERHGIVGLAEIWYWMAETTIEQGRAAELELAEARARSQESNQGIDHAWWLALSAHSHLLRHRLVEAREQAGHALDAARSDQDLLARFDVQLRCARVLAAAGEPMRAAGIFQEIEAEARARGLWTKRTEAAIGAAEAMHEAGQPVACDRLTTLRRDAWGRGYGLLVARADAVLATATCREALGDRQDDLPPPPPPGRSAPVIETPWLESAPVLVHDLSDHGSCSGGPRPQHRASLPCGHRLHETDRLLDNLDWRRGRRLASIRLEARGACAMPAGELRRARRLQS